MNKWIEINGGEYFTAYVIPEKISAITKWCCEENEFNLTVFVDGAGKFTLEFDSKDEFEKTFLKLQSAIKSAKSDAEESETSETHEVEKTTDNVNHPAHYNIPGRKECIVEMLEIFGSEKVQIFCELNAYKYRYRHEMKNGQEDLDKADWYDAKRAELIAAKERTGEQDDKF